MHGVNFLQDLAVVMIVAGIVTIIFHRFKQPVVLGYILAGVIVGPHTPPFPLIHDQGTINTLAELGVVLLMFALGLEFSLRKLSKVGAGALIAAVLEILLMVWVGYQVGRAFGWSHMDSIFLGAILSISSTTIIVKALHDLGKSKERFAQLIFGILIIEDLLGIAMIALLSGIAMTGSLTVSEVGTTLGKLGIFLAVVLVIGLLAVPRLIGYVARFRSNEMLLITVLALCFGFALLAVKLGYSVALGAFLIGAVIAEAREIHRIEALIQPVRDMFSAIFFVTIGLLIDPRILVTYWLPILVITAAVVIGKVLSCSFGALSGGSDPRTALRVGMGLAQIGEFSFIIASLGLSLGVTSQFLYPITVAVSVFTTLLTPYLIKSADHVVTKTGRIIPARLSNYLGLYTDWIQRWQNSTSAGLARRLIRKWTWQMALNLLLASGIFITASVVGQRQPRWMTKIPGGTEGANAALWFGAVMLSLPLFIATYRKLQALGLLLSEAAEQRSDKAGLGAATKAIVSNTVPVIGAVGMGFLVLVLSTAILPSGRLLLALIIIAAVLTIQFYRKMVRVYSKAQYSLGQTFSDPPAASEESPHSASATIFNNGQLHTVHIPAKAAAAGKFIRELSLRSVTGATIVAIERAGQNIVSPSPDEELVTGDKVLVVGAPNQVKAAEDILTTLRPPDVTAS